MEEVPTYKYLGETINNKGNLSDHIKEVESKIRGATSKIIAETGNKEFKGIKMKAVWQMVDAIIIPIITYACEGWTLNKEEQRKLQSIFNEALKTILYLPNGTPTTILLNETGNYPIEYTIKKKTSLTCQANRQHAKWIPHQRCHLIKKQWMEKRNKQNSGRTQCQRPNGRNVKRMPEETSPRRNKHQSYGRNRKWVRDDDKDQTLEG